VVRVPGYSSRYPGFRFPALPDVLPSSVSGMGSTQPRENNLSGKVAATGVEIEINGRGDPLR
jgi:hypothetical protein